LASENSSYVSGSAIAIDGGSSKSIFWYKKLSKRILKIKYNLYD
jgi:hypothetical protein